MKYGQIPGIDRPVSRVVLGSIGLKPDDAGQTGAIIERFLERGGNMIDTANIYAGGRSERSIGDWLRRTGRRDDLLILTKGAHHDAKGKRVSPEEISYDLGQSLDRLGTKYVDLYVLHRDDPDVPVGPIVDVLNYHARRGRITAFGGSNWSHQRLQEAHDYALRQDLTPFAVSSPNLGLAVPNEPMWADCISISGDTEALNWYRQSGLPIMSWASLSSGFFTGAFAPDRTDNKDIVRVYYSEGNWERLRRVKQLAEELHREPIQIALAWVLNQPDLDVHALVGPQTVAELDGCLDAAEINLTPEQVRWLSLDA